MKIKFSVHFKYGEVNWYNKDHWERFTADDILRCLIDFTEVREYACDFEDKDRMWKAKVTIPAMTTSNFVEKFKEALDKYYGRHEPIDVIVIEMKLEKGEVSKFTTALLMKKIEGSK